MEPSQVLYQARKTRDHGQASTTRGTHGAYEVAAEYLSKVGSAMCLLWGIGRSPID